MCAVYAPAVASAQASRPHHHGNARTCGTCGAVIVAKRGSRRQRFCSPKCRDAARRSRNFQKIGKTRYPHSGVPRSDKNSLGNSNASETDIADRSLRISRHRIIEIELIAPHDWEPVISADGVVSWVAYLRPSPLVRSAP